MFKTLRTVLISIVTAVALLGILAQAAGAATTPQLQNVGGRTPATKVTQVAPGNVMGMTGRVWAKSGKEKLAVTITGGAGVTPAYCHEDADEKYFCYVYSATGTLTGAFTTISNAPAPAGGAKIKGAVSGQLTASFDWKFFDQAYPYAKLVSGNVTSWDPKTWVRSFYGPGAAFALTSFSASYSYKLANCNQKWTLINGTSKGNITGC